MYSLVSTCIRPKVHEEDEEIILPTPPFPITVSTNSRPTSEQNLNISEINNQPHQHNHKNQAELVQKSNNVSFVPLQTPTNNKNTTSATSTSTTTTTAASLQCTQQNNHTPIPSIEVLHPSQSSSISECIIIQSPSRIRSRTSFLKSSLSSSSSSTTTTSSPSHAINSPPRKSHGTIFIPWTLSSDEDECNNTYYNNNQHNSNDDMMISSSPRSSSNQKLMRFVKKEIPLFYSPLCTSYNNSGGVGDGSNNNNEKEKKKKGIVLKNMHNKELHPKNLHSEKLKNHSERWKYQSSLAGSHSQHLHVLDMTHWSTISLQSIKYGITPQIAQDITDFKFCIVDPSFDIPSFLDLVSTMFPKLKHLTLQEKYNVVDDGHNNDHHQNDHEEDYEVNDDDNNQFKTPRNTNNNTRVKVYNADGDDQDIADDVKYYEVATASSQKIPQFPLTLQTSLTETTTTLASPVSSSLPHISSSIALKAMQMAEKESERMKRLYILYRLPDLISINDKLVTEEERKLARPMSPSGYKVKRQEWLTQAMAVIKSGNVKSKVNNDSNDVEQTMKMTNDNECTYRIDGRARSNSHYLSSEEDSSIDSVEHDISYELKVDTRDGESNEDDGGINVQAEDSTGILKSSNVQTSEVFELPSTPLLIASPKKKQCQHPTGKSFSSPSRSNLSGIFPHTGKSTTPKRPTTPKLSGGVKCRQYSPKTKHEFCNNLQTPPPPLLSRITTTTPPPLLSTITTPASSPPLQSTITTPVLSPQLPKHKIESSSYLHSIHSSPIKLAAINEHKNSSPFKTNLDTFIAKDKARGRSNHEYTPAVAPSEATDIAIVGHLLSRCNIPEPSYVNKENTMAYPVNPLVTQLETNEHHAFVDSNNDNSCSLVKNATKRGNKNSRRKERKERPMPLVGSMVRVKVKKGKRESLPPPSPASTFREFSAFPKRRNRLLASIVDQMDEEEDGNFEEEENDELLF